MTLKKIVSFGHRYGMPLIAPGVVIVDVRRMFRNPYVKLQQDPNVTVEAEVTKAADFGAKYAFLKEAITAPGNEVAYIGCYGGQHRSVFLAERLAGELGIPFEHRDLGR